MSRKQLDFLDMKKRYGLFDAGIGTGKSFVGGIWTGKMVLTHPGVTGLIVARDVPQLKKGTLVEFKKALSFLKLIEDVDYKHNKSDNTFKFKNGTQIDCVGANNYDSAFRAPTYGWMWLDELDYYKPEAWTAILGRLRTYPELMRATSSPKGFNFVWEHFINEDTKAHDAEFVKATTFDNPEVSDAYRESLKQAYSPRLYRQEVLGERLNLSVGRVYSEFDRDIHVGETVTYRKGEPIHIFLDYNVSSYLGMVVKVDLNTGFLHIVDEIHLTDSNSYKMVDEIKKRYPDNPIIISGDSTGNNKRDVSTSKSNYQIFIEAGFSTNKTWNPPVLQRIITVEAAFYHKKVVINKKCTTLIRDMELMSWKQNTLNNEVDKTDITLSHASDAFGYAVFHYLPLKPAKRKSSSSFL